METAAIPNSDSTFSIARANSGFVYSASNNGNIHLCEYWSPRRIKRSKRIRKKMEFYREKENDTKSGDEFDFRTHIQYLYELLKHRHHICNWWIATEEDNQHSSYLQNTRTIQKEQRNKQKMLHTNAWFLKIQLKSNCDMNNAKNHRRNWIVKPRIVNKMNGSASASKSIIERSLVLHRLTDSEMLNST